MAGPAAGTGGGRVNRVELAKVVGRSIADARCKRGITQEWLAATIEISQVTLSRYENGHEVVKLLTLVEISDALRCPLGVLLRGLGAEEVAS